MKNKDSVMATTSFNNSNTAQDLPRTPFEVCRIPEIAIIEEIGVSNNLVENNNNPQYKHKEATYKGFVYDAKSERRDSGFHTMTRHIDEPSDSMSDQRMPDASIDSVASTNSPAAKVTNGDATTSKKQFRSIHRIRSSPLIKRKNTTRRAQDAMDVKATQLAKQLFNLDGYDKKDVAQRLSQQDEFGLLVATKYMELFAFSYIALDEALRVLLKKFALIGETQERERILNQFAKRYHQCNPHFLDGDLDAVHILICATALLNTDLHGAKTGGRRKMTSKQFTSSLQQARRDSDGREFPPNLLKEIYRCIKKKPLPWCEAESRKPSSSVSKSLSIHVANSPQQSGSSSVVLRSQSMNPVGVQKVRPLPLSQENDEGRRVGVGRGSKVKTIPRKQGVLYRKAILERDGNKTIKRRRRWKCIVVALQGLELHIAKRESADGTKISLHHCLAEAEGNSQSTKRNNVIRLTLANRSVALYQASSKEEQKAWVRSINRNAALLSAAPLSAGIGSQVKFQRPLLPSACSTLPLAKQLEEQQKRLETLCTEMDEHENNSPRDGAPACEKQYYKDKLDYLRHEVHKYEVYTNSLSELVSSTRRSTRKILTKSADGDVDAGSTPETGSMLSVSPSEPGNIGFNNLSAFSRNGDSAGSIGDLLEADPKKRPRNLMVATSPLSPTSSLPNLHPIDIPRFPEASQKRQDPSETFELVPSVSETDSGSSSVRLIRQDVSSSSPHSSNMNNSNRNIVFDFDISSSSLEDHEMTASYATTGRIDTKSRVVQQISSNTVGRMEVRRHHADEVALYQSPLVVSTSYLSNHPVVFDNKALMRDEPRRPESQTLPVHHQKSPPRVRGRKERRGTARHSYLQAVYDPSHT